MSTTLSPKMPKDVGPRPKAFSLAVWRARWQQPKFRWFALGAAAVLLVSTIGAALFFAPRSDGHKYLEIYVTDFPGDFERFQLTMAGVYVGEEAYELQLDAKEFDILQYHGTGNSLLLAYGDVPQGDHQKLSVVFTRAQAYFGGQWIPIPIPHKMLTINGGIDLGSDRDGALLLDLEMERSLVLTAKGYTFEPYVKNLYEHEFPQGGEGAAEGPGRGTLARNGFTAPPVVDPGQKREDPPAPASSADPSDSASASPTPTCEDPCNEAPPGGSEPDESNLLERHLPPIPQGNLSGDSGGCPNDDFENPDIVDKPGEWAELQLLREACDLKEVTDFLYSTQEQQLTFVGQTAFEPVQVPKELEKNSLTKTEVNMYQGVPAVDVNDILDNLPDVLSVLDPATGSVMSQDNIQAAAGEIVRLGGEPLFAFSMSPAIAFKAKPQDAWAISQSDLFKWVELAVEGADVEFDSLATANVNTQLTPVRSLTAGDGHPYDGHGVGMAIIDTGVDGFHRDLPYDALGVRPESAAILENCLLNLPKNTYGIGAVPLVDQSQICGEGALTDARGHGTMVSGVALGRPPAADAQTATLMWGANQLGLGYEGTGIFQSSNWVWGPADTPSNVNQRGVAPGAKGYMISFAGDGSNILMATLAYDRLLYMLDHPQPGDPRILVVSNSWETSWQSTDENSLLYWQLDQIVDRGVTVVFSAGNGGGDGITPMTSPECVHPREGVVCVGAAEDNDRADRTMVNPWFASSRGARFSPTTWPDLCAPGTRIRTTFPTALGPNSIGSMAMGGGVTSPYALFTGTSAAAPYVAGVVALVQQARRDAGMNYLAPDQVEYVLEQGAYAFPNVSGGYALSNDARFNMSNYECGHGLVDIQHSLEIAYSLP